MEYFIIALAALALIAALILVLTRFGSSRTKSAHTKADRTPPEAAYRAENEYMQLAIDEARLGIYSGHGGPFGAVIVKNGRVVGRGHNMVVSNNDSTCHGEIAAIRNAEKALNTFDLSGCELYTTGEPCLMCLAACKWANIERVYYGCTIDDNSMIGFRDSELDRLLGRRENARDYLNEVDRNACLELFKEYSGLDKTVY